MLISKSCIGKNHKGPDCNCESLVSEQNWPCEDSKTGEMLAVVTTESFKTTPKNVFSKKANISVAHILLYQDVAVACLKSTSQGLTD